MIRSYPNDEEESSFSSTSRISFLSNEVSQIMFQIASMMKEPGDTEAEWLRDCFVSDESSVGDFFTVDTEINDLQKRLLLEPIGKRDLICDLAEALHDRNRTVN